MGVVYLPLVLDSKWEVSGKTILLFRVVGGTERLIKKEVVKKITKDGEDFYYIRVKGRLMRFREKYGEFADVIELERERREVAK